MSYHDLIAFPGARISLTSIHGIEDDMDLDGKPTGMVVINYGQGFRIGFEGSADDAMEIIDAYCEKQLAASLPPQAAGLSRDEFNALIDGVH